MQYCLCMMPFLEVTILFNQHLHYRGEYRGKIPGGHSNPIYSVLKLLKLQNSWHMFDRPVSSMYCKYAEYACKLQTNLSMNNKYCHDMQKKCNIVLLFSKCRIYSICQKTCSWSAKKTLSINHDRILEKMQHRLCIMPFLEVTILFYQHLHYRGEYRETIPDGHSNPICF